MANQVKSSIVVSVGIGCLAVVTLAMSSAFDRHRSPAVNQRPATYISPATSRLPTLAPSPASPVPYSPADDQYMSNPPSYMIDGVTPEPKRK